MQNTQNPLGVIPSGFESRRPHHCNPNGMFSIIIAMTDSGYIRRLVAIALLAAALPGCAGSPGGSSDETLGRVLFAPGKFALYSCAEIADRATAVAARQRELERLMAKAGADSGGQLVSSIAYRPEYLELRGEMIELRRVAAEKDCKFVPGADNPGARTSDKAIR